MRHMLVLLFHFLATTIKLLSPGGIKAIAAENFILRQQLIIMNRTRRRSPKLNQLDRTVFAVLVQMIHPHRLRKAAIILKPATLLSFHKALVKRKYQRLYSAKNPGKPGPKGPDAALIQLVVEMKHRNPRMGYDRIAMQVYQAFGMVVSKDVVRRILAKHYRPDYPGGPS